MILRCNSRFQAYELCLRRGLIHESQQLGPRNICTKGPCLLRDKELTILFSLHDRETGQQFKHKADQDLSRALSHIRDCLCRTYIAAMFENVFELIT